MRLSALALLIALPAAAYAAVYPQQRSIDARDNIKANCAKLGEYCNQIIYCCHVHVGLALCKKQGTSVSGTCIAVPAVYVFL